MGYLFLAISILTAGFKGYYAKRTSQKIKDTADALSVTFLRMVFCAAIGFVLLLVTEGPRALAVPAETLWIPLLYGVSITVNLTSWILAIRSSAFLLLDGFGALGLLVPLLLSAALLREAIRPFQWLGLLILFAAVLILCSYNRKIKGALTGSGLALLILNGASGGLAQFSQKLVSVEAPEVSTAAFQFYAFLFSALGVGLICLFLPRKKGARLFNGKLVGYVFILAACLFIHAYFLTAAAARLPSVVVFPVVQGSFILLSTFNSAVFFKERVTVRSAVGSVLVFLALVIINFL